MPDYIIIKNQDDLIKHFASHDAKCEYELDAGNKVYRFYGYYEGWGHQVSGCPICLKKWKILTEETRPDRAKKMLENYNNVLLHTSTYKKFIEMELEYNSPNYQYIANCCLKIELRRQEENG